MNQDKKMILEMLKDGKVSVEEAEELLGKTGASEKTQAAISSPNKKFLRVLVCEDGTEKVNINVPLMLAEVALKLIPKEKMNIEGIDLHEVLNSIDSEVMGDIVNVDNTDKNGKRTTVKVYVG